MTDVPGLYIHVPFCLSKCGYCSFTSITRTHLIPEFVRAVTQEMEFYNPSRILSKTSPLNLFEKTTSSSFPRRRESRETLKRLDSRLRGNDDENYPCKQGNGSGEPLFEGFDTIYIGGGTPSLLTASQIDTLLNSAHKNFTIDRDAEITMEVNPGDLSTEYLAALKKMGINRLNIGVQSFDDTLLKFLGRRHSATEAIAAIDAARKAGFDHIGIDFIYGVFGQDMTGWRQTLQKALTFSPEHLSCYQLSLDVKTHLYLYYQEHSLSLPSENEELDLFLNTSQILTDAGYIHYEVSNFARNDSLKSRHNTKYWRHIPYLGLGPSAHSFLKNRRWWNKAAVAGYLKDLSNNQSPVDQFEELSSDQLALEALFLGLRTKEGIHLGQYETAYGCNLLSDKKQAIDALIRNKLVELKDGCLRPTLDGMAVADSLALI